MLSIWEHQSFTKFDFVIIGSGITGLSSALFLKQKYPNAKIAVLERGLLPCGASTKNAGFACIGSFTEKQYDLKLMGEDLFLQLIAKRVLGLKLLRDTLKDTNIDYQQHGGYEIITQNQQAIDPDEIEHLNKVLYPIFNKALFQIQNNQIKQFGFNQVKQIISNSFEGQIDTGKMMSTLIDKVTSIGIRIITGCNVQEIEDLKTHVALKAQLDLSNQLINIEFTCNKLLVCTNAFLKKWLPHEDIEPGRGQVLCTKPVADLKFKGVFSIEEGYYYFRNYQNRIIFGGGRNLDFDGENTTYFGLTDTIQNSLEYYLKEVILPDDNIEIEYRWSGIMGFGKIKHPIIKQISENVLAAGRLNGMGISIGMAVAQEIANILE
jgi:glycine/D-amino acid oxidase-like deaminating enzyme